MVIIPEYGRSFYECGVEDGKRQATSIDLGESSYGACHSFVVVKEAPTRRALSRMVKDHNYRKAGDNPGQIYGATWQLIRAIKTDEGTWLGICIASTLRDV